MLDLIVHIIERDPVREHTNNGLAATTARGRNGGRKHRLTPEQMQAAKDRRAARRSVREIGLLLGNGKPVSRQMVYRALAMLTT
jgi:DNA invertase Pin-like site-specific DNA recombinase